MKATRLVRTHAFVVSFLVTLLALFIVEGYQRLGQESRHIKEGLVVVVFLQNSLSDAQALGWLDQFKLQDKDIESAVLTTKEQAFQKAALDPMLAKSLQLLKENPLPASVVIHYSDTAWMQSVAPVERLKVLPSITEIRWDPQVLSTWQSVERWRIAIRRLALLLLGVVGLWACAGIYRFFVLHLLPGEMILHVGWGLLGGGIAEAVWLQTLRTAFENSAMTVSSSLPLGAGIAGALACLGFRFFHAK